MFIVVAGWFVARLAVHGGQDKMWFDEEIFERALKESPRSRAIWEHWVNRLGLEVYIFRMGGRAEECCVKEALHCSRRFLNGGSSLEW